MFVKAVNKGLSFTKPLLTGKVMYKDRTLINLINTLLVLNKDGDILTTGNVANNFLMANEINEVFPPILEEINNGKNSKKIENKYGINDTTIIGMHNVLIDVADNPGKLDIIKHSYLDLAIIKQQNSKSILVNDFPVFNIENINIGKSVCALGFTFPEYSAFKYDLETEKIITTNKFMNFPVFPQSGIITRNIIDDRNIVSMFEINTPVLPGQNGGPVIDTNGNVIGLLSGTNRISSKYQNSMNFNLDLGVAISSKEIVKFLDDNKIKYNKILE